MLRYLALAGAVALVASLSGGTSAYSAVIRPVGPYLVKPMNHKCPAWPTGSGILKDGDYHEAGDVGANFDTLWKGSDLAPKWAPVKSGSVDFNGSLGWGTPAPNNVCTIDMDGIGAGSIQSGGFPTTPSATYSVNFIMSGNGYCGPNVKTLQVVAAGQSQQFSWDVASMGYASNGNWQPETWDFTATSAKTKLTFTSLDGKSSNCGPVIGAVSVMQN